MQTKTEQDKVFQAPTEQQSKLRELTDRHRALEKLGPHALTDRR